MTTAQQEIEWQFDADSLSHVETWLRERAAKGDLQFHFLTPEAQRDSYFDSPDWRIYRAGYALRTRVDGAKADITLKSFGNNNGSRKVRSEINERLDGEANVRDFPRLIERAPGPIGAHVRNMLGRQRLRRLFDLDTQRHRVLLRLDGEQIAEIALDQVRVAADKNRIPIQLQRVEVEQIPAIPAAIETTLQELVRDLRRQCDLRPAEMSKFQAGLAGQTLSPTFAPNLGYPGNVADLGPKPTTGELAFAVLREHFAEFVRHEPGSRMGEDAEDVHRMRVATRRLRAAMSLFRDYLPANAPHLREELGWIAGMLGQVRDLDVQLERAQAWHTDEASIDANALRSVEEFLHAMREPARARLLRAFNSARYTALLMDYEAMLLNGPTTDRAARPAHTEMPALILKRYAKVRQGGDAIDDDSPAESLHALRIECKRLRYALEFCEPLYSKAVRNFLPRLVELQDVLGEHQDAYVAIEQMRGLSVSRSNELPAQTIDALSEISQRYLARAHELRQQFARQYKRIKGKSWQSLQRALDDEL